MGRVVEEDPVEFQTGNGGLGIAHELVAAHQAAVFQIGGLPIEKPLGQHRVQRRIGQLVRRQIRCGPIRYLQILVDLPPEPPVRQGSQAEAPTLAGQGIVLQHGAVDLLRGAHRL